MHALPDMDCVDSATHTMSTAESEEESWIDWFCSLEGNEYFCTVDRRYIGA